MEYTIPNATVLPQDLAGKNAIVTGATRGIGRGIAFHLAARGANVLGTCSGEGSLRHIASLGEEIASLYGGKQEGSAGHHPPAAPKVVGVVAPLTEPREACAAVVAAVKEHFGGDVNILVQNAAVAEIVMIDDIDEGHVHRTLTGNIETSIFLVNALLPHLRPASRIVNISSQGARLAPPGCLVYAASKAALESLTRGWAEALGRRPGAEGTTVNALSVGVVRTDLVRALSADDPVLAQLEAMNKLVNVAERMGEPDDIAEIVGWLCTEKARWVTGSVMCASGGVTKIL